MSELLKLMKDFYNKNKSLVICSILFQVLYSVIESIIIPFVLSGAFNNIKDSEKFKSQLIKLVGVWIIVKVVGCISLHFHNKLEPEITKYIILSVIKSVFNKYEKDNHMTNVSQIIDRLHLLKINVHDVIHIVCTSFVPRLIVVIISCITFFGINKKIGLIVTICMILQYFLLVQGLSHCVETTYTEHTKKDKMYEYIEDLFLNINTIQSTTNGYDFEIGNLHNITERTKKSEIKTNACINNKQYKGFATSIAVFSFIFYNIYQMHKNGEISNEQTTTIILLVIGLFENMSDMSYYVPEFSHRFGILKSNETFLKELLLKTEKFHNNLEQLNNTAINFKNTSFKYPGNDSNYIIKDLTLEIPENKIIGIYGKSGVGKTTFIKLIFKSEEPTSGEILIGNKNIQDYDVRAIRKYISYVNQDTSTLFNRTIFDNITYGKSVEELQDNKTLEYIKNLFVTYNLYDIFSILDKGKEKWSFLNQKVGKLGGNLSGGQKKILHLMRLALNDFSKIVIMDEPTSSVDDNTRNNVINFIKHLNSKGKTILIITHDPYLRNICDKILEFSEGKNPEYSK